MQKPNRVFLTCLLAIAFAGTASAAAPSLEEVRKLLPKGTDVAGVAIAKLRAQGAKPGASPVDEAAIAAPFYSSADLNHDGIDDLAVIVEKAPKLVRDDIYSHEELCAIYDIVNCSIIGGARMLAIYLGRADGPLVISEVSTDSLVLSANDGGTKGDPLRPLLVKKDGEIVISTWGGSSDVWAYTDTIQFRKDGFYMIGKSELGYSSFDPENSRDSTETNLLTGKQIVTKGKRKTVKKVGVKPLVRLKDYVNTDL